MINKAIITAAGRGTRFLPVVKQYPKELIALMDKPNIQILVEEVINAGIKEICIVHRPDSNAIKDYFTPDLKLEKYLKENNKLDFLNSLQSIWDTANLQFIPQSDNLPYGNASPALAAKNFIGNDDFAYLFGDDLIIEDNQSGTYLKKMIDNFDKYNLDFIVSTQQMPKEEMKRYGAVVPINNPPSGGSIPNQISELLEKMDPPPSNFAVVGRYVVKNKIMDIIKTQGTSRDGELWWADSANALTKTGLAAHEPITNGKWMTTGDPIRWLKANIVLALQDPRYREELKEYIVSLRGV
jgi:UTP--glucose-1-phosphate uridylyltransferase